MHHHLESLLLLLPAVAAGPLPSAADLLSSRQNQPSGCSEIRVFLARGTTEPYPGRQGALADAICAKSGTDSCDYEDIVYPAVYTPYCDSAQAGVTGGTQQITDYVNECPDGKVVLLGYSQGGGVVGDILGGGGGVLGDCTQPDSEGLSPSTSPGSSVKAAALFGDVRHVANQEYNVGSGPDRDGIWPRSADELASLNEFSDVLHSWCIEGDPVCYSGGQDGGAHTSYFDVYLEEASDWVVSQL